MVFHGGYHGGVLYFVSGGSPVNMPYEYIVAPYNDVEGTRALLASTARRSSPSCSSRCRAATAACRAISAFLNMLREETWAHGITMIFDEVMTSRLSPGGLQAKLGVIPDMTTLGKYIGGGMSFGAFGGRREIMELFDPTKPDHLPHAGTFNNNALTMAAGVGGLRRGLYAGGGQGAERARREDPRAAERDLPEGERGVPVLRHRLDDDGARHRAADQDGRRHRQLQPGRQGAVLSSTWWPPASGSPAAASWRSTS